MVRQGSIAFGNDSSVTTLSVILKNVVTLDCRVAADSTLWPIIAHDWQMKQL